MLFKAYPHINVKKMGFPADGKTNRCGIKSEYELSTGVPHRWRTGICDAIVKAENTTIKARLDDESLKQLHDIHAQWLEGEKQMLADHDK